MRALLALLLLALVAVLGPTAAQAAPARLAITAGNGIDVVNADGSGRAQLLRPPKGGFAFGPAWSPDAQRIAYVSGGGDGEEDELTAVWTMAADGSDQRRLGPPRKDALEFAPAWSPDGREIAFARTRFRDRSLTTSLVVAAADGSAERTVVSRSARRLTGFDHVAWSPDGARLLYTRYALDSRNYFTRSLRSVATDGSDRRLVAHAAGGASFSPDGKAIAFVSIRDRNGHSCGSDECSYHGEIYTASADGSGARRLTRSKADDGAPAWSPDGAQIAFHSDRNFPGDGENAEVYSVGTDGSCLTWLTNGTPASGLPAWEPGRGGSSEPGACGDAGRAPLFGTDLTPLSRYTLADAYWLGAETPGHMLLSDAHAEGAAMFLPYDDCSLFLPRDCGKATDLYLQPVCRRRDHLYVELATRWRPSRFRGALLVRRRGRDGSTALITGGTHIDVRVRGGSELPVLGMLRRFGADSPPKRLPRAALPDSIRRRALRVERAFRRNGRNVGATARALESDRFSVRGALRVARIIRRFGPFERADC